MITISLWRSSNFTGSTTLLQIEEKNESKRVIVSWTFLGKILWIATGNNYCIKTWQSWDFKPTSFKYCIDTKLVIFEEYPCGILTLFRQRQNLSFFFLCGHSVTCGGQLSMLTNLPWCQVFSDIHFNQIQQRIYSIFFCLSLNVK